MKIKMDKKMIIYLVSFLVLFVIFGVSIFFSARVDGELDTRVLEGKVGT